MTAHDRTDVGRRRTRRDRLSAIARGLGPFARPHRRHLGVALGGSVLVTAAQLALPWPLAWMVDLAAGAGAPGGPPMWLPDLGGPVAGPALAVAVVGVVFGLGEYVQRVAIARFVVRTVNDARVGILARSLGPNAATGSTRDPGDVLTRVVGDTARLRVGMKGALVHILQHGLFLLGVSAVLFVLDVGLGLAYLGGLVVALGVAVIGMDRAAAMARSRRGRESRVVGDALQAVTTPGDGPVAKSLDRERSVAIITQLKGRAAWGVQTVLALAACLVLGLALRYAEVGRLSAGEVALVASYLLMLHYPMMRLGRQITRLGPQLTSAERLTRLAEPAPLRFEAT
ncbi:MAG: ABC transporter ATP-binding protein [Sporichthyaceae bacterium]|nr:ABC transporter ATP-binding protein [Sporichthyaceae bacterium]